MDNKAKNTPNTPASTPAAAAASLEKIAANAILARVGGDPKHGWGNEDSLAVIGEIWRAENGDEMPAHVRAQIARFINPSAFRQYLEKLKVLDKSDAKRGSKADALAGLLTSKP